MESSGCPCSYTTPCHPDCTCVKPFMSGGCSRCCKYGSIEQKTMMAKMLANIHGDLEDTHNRNERLEYMLGKLFQDIKNIAPARVKERDSFKRVADYFINGVKNEV